MTWLTEIADRRARAKKMLVIHKSRFWLAHRNGRVAAESGCEMPRANPYRRNSPSWRAFNESHAIAMARDSAETACPAPVLKDCQARAESIAQEQPLEPKD